MQPETRAFNAPRPPPPTPHQPNPYFINHTQPNRSNKWLTLKTSALETLYGQQFTLLTQLIKPNYHC